MIGRILDVWGAGWVRRWHMSTVPALARSDDFNAGHQGRVARLVLALHPDPSRDLLAAALTHDDGEKRAGDISSEAKRAMDDDDADRLDRDEQGGRIDVWGKDYVPTDSFSDAQWLHFADKLDALMWATSHAPLAVASDEWEAAIRRLQAMADALGCNVRIYDVVDALS